VSCNSLRTQELFHSITLRSGIELRKLRSELTGRSVECSPLSPLAYTLRSRATPHVASRRVVGLSARSASSLRENQSEVHPRTFARQARKSPRAHFVDWIAVSRLLIYQTPSSQAEPFRWSRFVLSTFQPLIASALGPCVTPLALLPGDAGLGRHH
jgi:hypothetical protein